jgi:hypothetical protein
METTNPQTPLSEADPKSLDALFARDPLALTDDDVRAIASKLRQDRGRWMQEDIGKKQSRGQPKKDADPNLKLEDLGL